MRDSILTLPERRESPSGSCRFSRPSPTRGRLSSLHNLQGPAVLETHGHWLSPCDDSVNRVCTNFLGTDDCDWHAVRKPIEWRVTPTSRRTVSREPRGVTETGGAIRNRPSTHPAFRPIPPRVHRTGPARPLGDRAVSLRRLPVRQVRRAVRSARTHRRLPVSDGSTGRRMAVFLIPYELKLPLVRSET